MIKISDAKRIVKRVILANLAVEKRGLSLTPLLSGRHGIGKSMLVKQVADDINGVLLTVEGGSLKEGEITGLPYQYMDENGKISFRFLPYYVVERIQKKEKEIYLLNHSKEESDALKGDINRYSDNDIKPSEKISLLLEKKIQPVIVFFDEINRSDPQVYKELMNILLTRSVNGYNFPWWVFFVGAMNPANSSSTYQTNEMDPAQLDRFIKLDVKSNSVDFLNYAKANDISPVIQDFIKGHRNDLFADDDELDDDVTSTPSPRGYDMLDTILKSVSITRPFFTAQENALKVVRNDLKVISEAKLGKEIGDRFFEYYQQVSSAVTFADFINDDEKLNNTLDKIIDMSLEQKSKLGLAILNYLSDFSSTISGNWALLVKIESKIKYYLKTLDRKTKIQFANDFVSSTTRRGQTFMSIYHDIYTDLILPILEESKALKDSFFD